jgi:hypothetical protein
MSSDQGISHILKAYDLSPYAQNSTNGYYPKLSEFGPQVPIPRL